MGQTENKNVKKNHIAIIGYGELGKLDNLHDLYTENMIVERIMGDGWSDKPTKAKNIEIKFADDKVYYTSKKSFVEYEKELYLPEELVQLVDKKYALVNSENLTKVDGYYCLPEHLNKENGIVKDFNNGEYCHISVTTEVVYGRDNLDTVFVRDTTNCIFTRDKVYYNQEIAEENGYSTCRYCSQGYSSGGRCACPQLYGYHGQPRKDLRSDKNDWIVGMEVENVDQAMLDGLNARATYEETGIILERDGSLGSGGFEAVFPMITLFDEKQVQDFIYNKGKVFINARHDQRCGGHITISHPKWTPGEVFDKVKYYLPLLYAMYPSRKTNGYSRARSSSYFNDRPSAREAIYMAGRKDVKGSKFEVRFFPSPDNVDSQYFRVNLLRYMVKNEIDSYTDLIHTCSHDTILYNMIKDNFKNEGIRSMKQLLNSVKANVREFENAGFKLEKDEGQFMIRLSELEKKIK